MGVIVMQYDETYYNRIFSKNLNYYLTINNITQAELAKKLCVSTASVSYWCKGQKSPRMDKVDSLCSIFRCTRSDLMDEHNTFSTPPAPVDPDADAFIEVYKNLDSTDRTVIKATANTLLNADKYKKDTGSSSA